MRREYACLLCSDVMDESEIRDHKRGHGRNNRYGMMWPQYDGGFVAERDIPTYESDIIAERLGVGTVFIRDEGVNYSGSMKDYGVEHALMRGIEGGATHFYVTSSGNHAVALALSACKFGVKSIVFTTASSSKINFLRTLPNVLVVAVKDAIFEDVYNLVSEAELEFEGLCNVNASNEYLLHGFSHIATEIMELYPKPTHVLAGVGNGTYLAGITFGFDVRNSYSMPKIVPVGMKGAFPTEEAYRTGARIYEYETFLHPEKEIDAAEGSIATESYSMPQLMYALQLSEGFTLGSLTNHDLREAYLLLSLDDNLLENGVVPEPTGIMGLAAALKYKKVFSQKDNLLISFTGHGVKDLDGIERLVPERATLLCVFAVRSRPDLMPKQKVEKPSRVCHVNKSISAGMLRSLVFDYMGGYGED